MNWMWMFLDLPKRRAPALQRFWCAATEMTLTDLRGTSGEFATLAAAKGDPFIKLQQIEEPRSRVHLDLDTEDALALADHAVGLGAAWVAQPSGEDFVVLRSPGGFLFCATTFSPATGGAAMRQDRSGDLLLDQICLDIPTDRWQAELEFWSRLVREPVLPGGFPQFSYLALPDRLPIRVLLQRLDDARGPVTAHPDFACRRRKETVAAHQRLGAAVVHHGPRWTTMTAPDGLRYCLTDRDPETGRLA